MRSVSILQSKSATPSKALPELEGKPLNVHSLVLKTTGVYDTAVPRAPDVLSKGWGCLHSEDVEPPSPEVGRGRKDALTQVKPQQNPERGRVSSGGKWPHDISHTMDLASITALAFSQPEDHKLKPNQAKTQPLSSPACLQAHNINWLIWKPHALLSPFQETSDFWMNAAVLASLAPWMTLTWKYRSSVNCNTPAHANHTT